MSFSRINLGQVSNVSMKSFVIAAATILGLLLGSTGLYASDRHRDSSSSHDSKGSGSGHHDHDKKHDKCDDKKGSGSAPAPQPTGDGKGSGSGTQPGGDGKCPMPNPTGGDKTPTTPTTGGDKTPTTTGGKTPTQPQPTDDQIRQAKIERFKRIQAAQAKVKEAEAALSSDKLAYDRAGQQLSSDIAKTATSVIIDGDKKELSDLKLRLEKDKAKLDEANKELDAAEKAPLITSSGSVAKLRR